MTGSQILERRFGVLAVKKGLAGKEQIRQALKEQKRLADGGEYMFVGDILIQAEVIFEKQRTS